VLRFEGFCAPALAKGVLLLPQGQQERLHSLAIGAGFPGFRV
jgi:hypothetical protein